MKAAEAKQVARDWVLQRVDHIPGLWGVIFGGSINWLPDDAEVGQQSDIDLWHYIKGKVDPGLRQTKLLHKGLILEPAYFESEPLTSVEQILGDSACGSHFTCPSAIYDPTGVLRRLQPIAARRFAEPAWIRKRYESSAASLREKLLPALRGEPTTGDRWVAFVFAVNAIEQIPAIAQARPLTVRKGGMVFTDIMRALHREDISERRLELVGSVAMSKSYVEGLLDDLDAAHTRAAKVWRTPFWGDFDVQPASRACMIGGARDLIDRGYHREAVWWIFAGHYVAHLALMNDAPQEYEKRYRARYEALLDAMGIGRLEGLARKAVLAEELLARVMLVADDIVGGMA